MYICIYIYIYIYVSYIFAHVHVYVIWGFDYRFPNYNFKRTLDLK